MKKDRIISFWLFLFMSTLYLITMSGHFYTIDEEMHYRLIDSMLLRQTITVEISPNEDWAPYNTVEGKNGKIYSKYGMGQSIAAVPLYLLGRGMSILSGVTHNNIVRLFVSFFNQFTTALICAIMFLFQRKLGYSIRTSIFSALVLGLCTMVWPYSKYFLNMPLVSFLLFFSFYLLSCSSQKDKINNLSVIIAGVFFGFSLITRSDMFIYFPAFFLYLFFGMKFNRWKLIALFSTGMSIAFPMFFWYSFVRTGNLFTTGYPSCEKFSSSISIGL